MGIYSFILLLLICLSASPIRGKNKFNENYLSRDMTTSIKGIFILMIFLTHTSSYLSGKIGTHFSDVFSLITQLGQAVVVMFFFYSGYGIMEAFKAKGDSYVKQFPYKRILKVLIHFDIALILYIILDIIVGRKLDAFTLITSVIGWSTIGNSNWFIFAMLMLYVISYISLLIFRKNKYLAALLITALTVIYMVIVSKYRPARFYNTVLTFALGIWYSIFKPYIEKFLMKKDIIYYPILVLVAGIFSYLYYFNVLYYSKMIIFSILIVLLSMKFELKGNIFLWYGKISFSVFILMRLPMIFMTQMGICKNIYLFTAAALVVTTLISFGYDKLLSKVDKLLYAPKNK